MRDRMLHDSLRALTDDAARLLDDHLASGAEIPFEVGEAPARDETTRRDGRNAPSATMFAYRPLTSEFVVSHADQLRQLPTFENAAQHLARTRGMIAYLRVRDEPVLDVGELTHARLGALAFLGAVWADAEQFGDWGDRFERAYTELESVALAERLVTTVFIPIHGVVVEGDGVNLGAGVELIRPDELDPDCAERFSDSAAGADAFCSISVDAPSDAPTPMAEVRALARNVLTSLRLFKPGSVAMSMTAQADTGGAWHHVSLPFSGKARDAAWHLFEGEEDELRQFLSAVRRVEKRTRVAWALKRFEMGLERGVPAEGLTDFLIALAALLEVRDEAGRAAMPARVSALCAREDERAEVRAVMEAAFALERLAVDGAVGRQDRKRLAKRPPLDVIADTERHLRALLHDLVCGYLSTDLRALADEILTADGQPAGSEDLVPEPTYLEPVPAPGAVASPDPTATVEFEAVFDDTAEIAAIDVRAEEAAEDNVWQLRPASEIAPAPKVTPEPRFEPEQIAPVQPSEPEVSAVEDEVVLDPVPEPDTEMHGRAEDLVAKFTGAFDATIEPSAVDDDVIDAPVDYDVVDVAPPAIEEPVAEVQVEEPPASGVPSWEENPERRPVTERPAAPRSPLESSIEPGAATGFTFDFKKVDVPGQKPAEPVERRIAPPANPEGVEEFPVPEFGLSVGPGEAAQDVDRSVEGPSQRERFREIMNENFSAPAMSDEEQAGTPFARDKRAHLKPIDGAAEELAAKPRIVHPDVFGSAPTPEPPAPPVDPNATVEWDAMSAETSAEEAAQLAWSEQFLRRPEEQPAEEPVAETTPVAPTRVDRTEEEPQLRLVPPSVDEEIIVTRAEPVEPEALPAPEATAQPTSSEAARTHKIGPATIEFRPVVDPDTDDPDDFAGAC